VTLLWETAAEIDTAGFNVLRSESEEGEFGKINAELIPAKGGPTQGAAYSYVDNGVQTGVTYWYKLQDVDTTGESYIHDPVLSVTPAADGWGAGSDAQASEMGAGSGAGSEPFNAIVLLLVPIGAFLLIRMRRRR
jgi:hypothetical protein